MSAANRGQASHGICPDCLKTIRGTPARIESSVETDVETRHDAISSSLQAPPARFHPQNCIRGETDALNAKSENLTV